MYIRMKSDKYCLDIKKELAIDWSCMVLGGDWLMLPAFCLVLATLGQS